MKKKVNLDMAQIKEALAKLGFLKSYSFLLLPIIITIVAILLYIPTPIINGKLQKKIQAESIKKAKNLASIGKEVVSKDQWKQQEKASKAYLEDLEKIEKITLQSTQRNILDYNIFPQPAEKSVAVFKQFGQKFQEKLAEMIKKAGAGGRPTDVELGIVRQSNSRASKTQVTDKVRKALCLKRANSISFYASPYDLDFYNYWSNNVSTGRNMSQNTVFEYTGIDSAVEDCWYTQIAFWITQDIIDSIINTNGASSSVYLSPVKRLISLDFSDESSGSKDSILPGYVLPPQQDDYDSSYSDSDQPSTITARKPNDDIDIVYFNFTVAIDAKMILPFMKELCSAKKHKFNGFDGKAEPQTFEHNQITILDADFATIDRQTRENQYYRYGDAAVVELVLNCEYIFDKQGYYPVKPDSIKKLLNEQLQDQTEDEQFEEEDEDSGMPRRRPPRRREL